MCEYSSEFIKFWKSLRPSVQAGVIQEIDLTGKTLAHRIAAQRDSSIFFQFWGSLERQTQQTCAVLTDRRGWTVAHTVARYLDADAFIPFWHALSPTLQNTLAITKTPDGEVLAHLVMRNCPRASFSFWENLSEATKNKLIEMSDKNNRSLIQALDKGSNLRDK